METKSELVPKYKVGDRIKIRSVPTIRHLYATTGLLAGWGSPMEEFCDKSYVISSVEISNNKTFYKYKFLKMPESMQMWTWSDDMFDLDVSQEEIEKQENEFLELIGF